MTTLNNDKEAIRSVLAQYCYCVDGGQADRITEIFTVDCVWDGGDFGRFTGHDGLRQLVSIGAGNPMQHHTTNSVITVNGDRAQVASYAMVLNIGQIPPAIAFTLFYDDELVKHNGNWLIKSRTLVPTMSALLERRPV